MKKLTLIVLILVCTFHNGFAQDGVQSDGESTYNEFATKAMELLDPTDFKNGILYDKVYPLAALNIFNQDNNRKDTSDIHHFLQAWHELYTASENPDFMEAMLVKEGALHYEKKNIVQIGLINVDFTVLDSTALKPKNGKSALKVKNNKLVKTEGENPYLHKQALIVAPMVSNIYVENNEAVFNFNRIELEKSANPVKQLDMYLDNGRKITIIEDGARVLEEKTVTFKTDGIKTIQFKVRFKDNKTITTFGQFNIEFLQEEVKTKSASGTQVIGGASPIYTITSTSPFTGYYDEPNCSGTCYGQGEYKIYYGNYESKILKPFIIVDGFDPGDNRKIESNDVAKSLWTGLLRIDKDDEHLLGNKLREKGYDVIILSFPEYKIGTRYFFGDIVDVYRDGGADYIERNAKVLEALIEHVNNQLTVNGSNEELVIDADVDIFPDVNGTIYQNGQSSPLYDFMNMVNSNEWVDIDINCPGASSIDWNLTASSGNPDWYDYGYGSFSNLELFFPSSNGYAEFEVSATSSSCGTTTKNYVFVPGYSYYSYSMSPNPVINEITINRFAPGDNVNTEFILDPWQRKGQIEVNEDLSGVENSGTLKSADIIMRKKPVDEDFQVEIYNVNGGKLKSIEGKGNSTTISLQGLSPGAYFLQIVTPTEIYKEKIIKHR